MAVAATCAGPALADNVACTMADGTRVDFVIDRSQFVTAVSPEEPIRRKVTIVRMGDAAFPAEPFIIGDRRGFHAAGPGAASIMFVIGPDGAASRTELPGGTRLTGTCEVE